MAEIEFVKVIAVGPRWNKVLASDGNVYTFRGDYNWRSNNPGNIEYGPFAIAHGAIGAGAVPKGRERAFAIFPSIEVGERARVTLQFEKPSYRNKTIADAISSYAPESENNTAAYAAAVAAAAGVSVNTKMSDLTPAQRQKFLAAQSRVEGMRPGKIIGEAGKPVPASVVQQFKGTARPPVNVGPAPVPADRSIATRASQVITEPSGGMPPVPRPRPASKGTVLVPSLSNGVTPLTFDRPAAAAPAKKPPVPGLVKVVPGRAPAKPAVQASGRTVAQIGQEADNARLSGYRQVQEMGPSSKGAPAKKPAPASKIPGEYVGGVGGAGIAGQVPLPKGIVPKGAAAAMDQAKGAMTKPPVSGLIQLVDPTKKKDGIASIPAGMPLNSGSRDSVANRAAGRAAAASMAAIAQQKAAAAAAARQRVAEAHQQRLRTEAKARGDAARAQAQRAAASRAAVLARTTTVVDKLRQTGMSPSQAYDAANRDNTGISNSQTHSGVTGSGRAYNFDTNTWV